MCTAVSYHTKDHYFGRNLDFECSYGESVTITPRRFLFCLPEGTEFRTEYAMIGMAHVAEGTPLYYDVVNEKGACHGRAAVRGQMQSIRSGRRGRTTFPRGRAALDFWGNAKTVAEARVLLERIAVTDAPFSEALQPSPMHWMLADASQCLVIEQMADGLHLYDNPIGVLANNPPFPFHRENIRQYLNVTAEPAQDRFSGQELLSPFSRGMGGLGLPGDLSSASRFVRAAFVKLNSRSAEGEKESVSQFFHILGAVEQQRGCCYLGDGKYEITIYSSCCNLEKGIYYYKTYDNHSITAVELHKENLDGEELICYPLA